MQTSLNTFLFSEWYEILYIEGEQLCNGLLHPICVQSPWQRITDGVCSCDTNHVYVHSIPKASSSPDPTPPNETSAISE
ncbi:hypothetical protein CEXT_409041 [Caerostris extrusa]|uniref:Uncharacterized protein n=1 Tax=Caerostris extrusa TaxID=172846 RepID=A0AAV4RFS6_CAEEX|nr:hypothetical protein CEXT_409041 [Caerostris extrusa]